MTLLVGCPIMAFIQGKQRGICVTVGQFLPSPFWIMPKYGTHKKAVGLHFQKIPRTTRYILAFHLEHTIAVCRFDVRSWYLFCKCYLVHGCVNDRFWPIVEVTGRLGIIGAVQ